MCALQNDAPEVDVHRTPSGELKERARRLRAVMREHGLDGLFATQNADVFYLSGVVQQAQVYAPVEGEPLLMVRKHPGRALADSELEEAQVVPVRSLRELPGLVERAGGATPKRIGFELDTLPVAIFNAYAKSLAGLGAELVDGSMAFKQVRALKSPYELEQIGRAAQV